MEKRKQEYNFHASFSYEMYIDEIYLKLQAALLALKVFCNENRRDELIEQFVRRLRKQ